MTIKPKVGLLVTALLEDDYNKTAHMRPAAQKFVDRIAGILGQYADVVTPKLVEEEYQAEEAARLFNTAGVDLIVAAQPAYTKGIIPTRAFLGTTAPVIVWNTQQIRSLPDNADFDLIMVNSGFAGVPEMTSALTRIGRKFWTVTSHIEDQAGVQKLADWISAAGVVRRLKTARIGTIAGTFEGATDMMVDQLSLRRYIGPVCWPIEPETVASAMEGLSSAQVSALVNIESARYRIEVDAPSFEQSCRLALALEQIAREKKIDALASFDYIWLNMPRVGIIASYGTGRLCEIGIPTTTEGDIVHAAAMIALQELTGSATFIEPYVIDFDRNAVILSHDGHGNPVMAASPSEVTVKASIYYEGLRGRGAGWEFAYKPGAVTLLSLICVEDHWRFVASEGESLAIKPRSVAAPQMLFKPKGGDIQSWCDAWLMAGGPHHMGLAYGHVAAQLEKVTQLIGIEASVV
jgi:L-arabinose isomerase